jgi:hypothetical protein
MKKVEEILEIIAERKERLLDQMKGIQEVSGTHNLGYTFHLGAYDELNYLLEDIKGI